MSASDKKKLRKELNAASMTERQKEEQKKQKKQKTVTLTFLVVMLLVVATVLTSALATPIKRATINKTVAAQVADHKINATELNYYYVDSISNLYGQYSDYGDYQALYVQMGTGWNPAKPVGEQVRDEKTGETWADYFMNEAVEGAKWTYAMYDLAMADEDFKLTEDDEKAINNRKAYMEFYGTMSASGTADGYLRAVYGASASLESYMEYYRTSYIATAYASEYFDSLEYKSEDFREYEKDKMEEFNSFSWLSYYVKASDYLTGGTKVKDEDGKESIQYSDDEKKASVEGAKADAEILLAADINELKDFNSAIMGLAINKDSKTEKTANEYTNQVYSYVSYYTPSEEAVEWLTSADRKEGDKKIFEYTIEETEGKEVVKGYYVLCYTGSIDNTGINVGNVRHLLVAFEKDKDGKVTDEADKKAKEEAEKLLKEYKNGKQTEETFTLLIEKNSDDTKDGLYENITPDSGFVKEFTDWAIADHKEGDVEIVKTEYGYHIMYYIGANDLDYRDSMIEARMQSEDYTEWEEGVLKDVKAEILEDKHIDKDFVLNTAG